MSFEAQTMHDDLRPLFPVPRNNAPWGEVMQLLDNVLGVIPDGHKMKINHLAYEIEKRVGFYIEDKKGMRRLVRLQTSFVRHYRHRLHSR
jgi:hypothetical protein